MSEPQVSLMFDAFRVAGRYEALMRQVLRDEPVSLMGYGILSLVRSGTADTPSGIAQAFGAPRSSITTPLRALEDAGLIDREADATDGRSHRLRLTRSGQVVHARVARAARELIGEPSSRGLDVPGLRADLATLADLLDDRLTHGAALAPRPHQH